jgi:hypothetical protein
VHPLETPQVLPRRSNIMTTTHLTTKEIPQPDETTHPKHSVHRLVRQWQEKEDQRIAASRIPLILSQDERTVSIAYTPAQKNFLATKENCHAVIQEIGILVSDDPHAMIVSVGAHCGPNGETLPCITTERVPGVLVQRADFVSGFHFGMTDAYESAKQGRESLSEEEVVNTFLDLAADAVMIRDEDLSHAFLAGTMFGYIYGTTLIGKKAFQRWVSTPFLTEIPLLEGQVA